MVYLLSMFISTALLAFVVLANLSDTPLETSILKTSVPTYQHEFPATGCFDCGQGVDRTDAVIAANAICNYYYGTTLYQNGFGSGGVGYISTWEKGNIFLTFIPFWKELGCITDDNYMFLDFDQCYYGFMTPIDYCNTGGENGKQGGYYWDQCGNVTINPNPDGCSEGKVASPDTFKYDLASGFELHVHHATEAEHTAARAAVMELERAAVSGS